MQMAGRNNRRIEISFLFLSSILSLLLWELFLRQAVVRFVQQRLGEHTTKDEERLFRQLDTDQNGLLSSYEWLPYFYQCARTYPDKFSSHVTEKAQSGSSRLENADEIITIQALFKPVQLETLKKDLSFLSLNELGALTGLISWTQPYQEWKNFAARDFSVFLPASSRFPKVGDTWWVVAPVQPSSGQLSSNRHEPPPVGGHLRFLADLFGMFHKRPFLVTRFHPQGTLATLRAHNSQLLDIVFRTHLEFQLNEEDKHPLWFTPAQFRGRVIMDRRKSTVRYFFLELPTDRRLNVDLEWLNGPNEFENMEVDIAYVPLMSLKSTGPSVSVNLSETKAIRKSPITGPLDYQKDVESLLWDKEVTMEQAFKKLERGMYSFTEVPYYNLTEALTIADREAKAVHAILLWGSLDDQSC